jgi:hypothetical protein
MKQEVSTGADLRATSDGGCDSLFRPGTLAGHPEGGQFPRRKPHPELVDSDRNAVAR